MSFAGGNSNTGTIDTAYSSGFVGTQTFTLSIWNYRDSAVTYDFDLLAVIPGTTTENALEFFYLGYGMNRLQMYLGSTTANAGGSWGIAIPSANTFHHICLSRDGASASNDPTIEVDGTSQTLTKDTNPTGTLETQGAVMMLGNDGATDQIGGDIAHMGMWDIVLSSTIRTALSGTSSPINYPTNRIFYAPLQGTLYEHENGAMSLSGSGVPTYAADGLTQYATVAAVSPLADTAHLVLEISEPLLDASPTADSAHALGALAAPILDASPTADTAHVVGAIAAPILDASPTADTAHVVGSLDVRPLLDASPTADTAHAVGSLDVRPLLDASPTADTAHAVGAIAAPLLDASPTADTAHTVQLSLSSYIDLDASPTADSAHAIGSLDVRPLLDASPTADTAHAVGAIAAPILDASPTADTAHVVAAHAAPILDASPTADSAHVVGSLEARVLLDASPTADSAHTAELALQVLLGASVLANTAHTVDLTGGLAATFNVQRRGPLLFERRERAALAAEVRDRGPVLIERRQRGTLTE